ncbi:MAG TPA: DsrE family protein [Noviherbaspirillum sp.]|uniref:DsrE family protein n=1 Tax=Noviherbaspirillum sp. TaxID=1926288 RepID=UPI002D280A6A|nr:DsrE family protein [Noviherbaspirillum sp.]HYD97487.1 DsrE family protein [Noviherbaspirillum sp.]
MRRSFLRLLAAGLAAMMLGASPAVAAQEPVRVVYHLADGIDQAARAMGNMRNHLRAEPDTKIVVVANGDGVRFLLSGARERSGKPFDAQVAALQQQGVEFRLCNNTLAAHDIPVSQVLPGVKLVPSGVVEAARLQAREGFVYLRP